LLYFWQFRFIQSLSKSLLPVRLRQKCTTDGHPRMILVWQFLLSDSSFSV
jgi:hypothetical protein